jgi:hypothetical protein
MLNALGSLLKTSAFIIGILLAGQWIEWDGKTLSSHVQRTWNQTMNLQTLERIKEWAKEVTHDATEGAKKLSSSDEVRSRAAAPARNGSEEITSSEREKLRNLIRELNGNRR